MLLFFLHFLWHCLVSPVQCWINLWVCTSFTSSLWLPIYLLFANETELMPYYLNVTFANHILIREKSRPYLAFLIFPQFFFLGLFYVTKIETSNTPGKLLHAQWDSINYWVSGVLKKVVIWNFKIRGSFVCANHFRYCSKEKYHILYGCEMFDTVVCRSA